MTVDDDIHLFFLENAHIHFGPHRRRRPKEDIGNIRGHHGSTPAISERRSAALMGDILVVLIHPHMGPVQKLHDLPHGTPGYHPVFSPGLQGLFRDPLGKGDLPFYLGIGTLLGQLFGAAMQIAEDGLYVQDHLSVEGDTQPEHTVSTRVLGPYVYHYRFGA